MELFSAHKQWSTRPDDERFTSLRALYDATKHYADVARERTDVALSTLRVENIDGEVKLTGRGGVPAKLTHWAFGQLATRIGAPAAYLRALPATLAVQNLNHGLAARSASDPDATANLLFHLNGEYVMRAITSNRYERIWNYEVAERLLALEAQGWEPARPDIRVIDDRLPLYASDHDMFAFIRQGNYRIEEPGNPAGLQRGVIVENSEVGAGSLRLTRFLYREMCGNHIIWGAQDVTELALRHVGKIRDRMSAWDVEIRKYLESSASADEAAIVAAQRKRIAGTKDEVLDRLFGMKTGLSRKVIEAGVAAVVEDEDGDNRTVWGVVQGLTRHSQTLAFGDERTTIDKLAGRLLDAF